MKRIFSVLLLASLLFTTAVCLTSCQEDDGAQISVYLSDRIYGFDPAGDYLDDATVSVMYLLYEPLFVLDDDGDVQEGMAEDYDFEDETGDLVITLRESYWTSGKRVTADDFVYAWRRIISPENAFDCAPLLYDVKNARYIKTSGGTAEQNDLYGFGAVAEDIDTLRIRFESAEVDRDAFLRNLTNISLAPVSRESMLGQESFWSNGASTICYTNGPFKIKELDNGGYFTLTRNDGYHRPEESGKAVDYFVVPEMLRTVWNTNESMTNTEHLEELYQRMTTAVEHTVFYMSELSLADRRSAAEDAEVFDALSTYTYIFNTDNELFADARVRTILSSVIDRNAIAQLVTFAKPATGFISHGVWDSTSARAKKSFRNVGGELISASATLTADAAKAQLASIGARTGSFTITYEDREADEAIAKYVAEQWGALGYRVELKPCTYYVIEQDTGGVDSEGNRVFSSYHASALERRYEDRDFDVIAVDYQMFSTNAFAALATLSGNLNGMGVDIEAYNRSEDAGKTLAMFRRDNIAGYQNDAYDALLAQAVATDDLKERATLLHDAEKLLIEDMPVIPLLFNQNFYVTQKNLKKLDVNYYGFTVFTRAKLKNYEDFFLDN